MGRKLRPIESYTWQEIYDMPLDELKKTAQRIIKVVNDRIYKILKDDSGIYEGTAIKEKAKDIKRIKIKSYNFNDIESALSKALSFANMTTSTKSGMLKVQFNRRESLIQNMKSEAQMQHILDSLTEGELKQYNRMSPKEKQSFRLSKLGINENNEKAFWDILHRIEGRFRDNDATVSRYYNALYSGNEVFNATFSILSKISEFDEVLEVVNQLDLSNPNDYEKYKLFIDKYIDKTLKEYYEKNI